MTIAPSKLCLIHVPGADWQLIQPKVDAGRMPNLERLITQGTIGSLFSNAPLGAPIPATTVATGLTPVGHGVTHILQPQPSVGGFRLTDARDVTAPRFWDIAACNGVRTAVVGWPLTHPAPNGPALVVSDGFGVSFGPDFYEWAFDPATVSDPSLHDTLSELRMHPTDMDAGMVMPFLPEGQSIDPETDGRAAILAQALARAVSVHGAGTWIAEHHDWNLLTVSFDMIERLSTSFMQFREPQMQHVTDAEFAIYRHVVDGAYLFLDLMLGRYMELIDDDATIMVVSEHGFLNDALRAIPVANAKTAVAARAYREMGVFVASGPGIRADNLVFGATSPDILPTVLAVFGLPAPDACSGKVLHDIFEREPAISDAAKTPELAATDAAPSEEIGAARMFELAANGYIGTFIDDAELAAEQVRIQALNNLSAAQISASDREGARETARQAVAIHPDNVPARLTIARTALLLGDLDEAGEMLRDLVESGVDNPMTDMLSGQIALKSGKVQDALSRFSKAEKKARTPADKLRILGNAGRILIANKQAEPALNLFQMALDIDRSSSVANAGMGAALVDLDRPKEALSYLQRSLGTLQHQLDVLCNLGHAHLKLGAGNEAAKAYRKALELAPDFKPALEGLRVADEKTAKSVVAAVQRRLQDE